MKVWKLLGHTLFQILYSVFYFGARDSHNYIIYVLKINPFQKSLKLFFSQRSAMDLSCKGPQWWGTKELFVRTICGTAMNMEFYYS